MEALKQCLAIGVGGFCGALARYFVANVFQRIIETSFPFGTLVVNISGCFILGFFSVFAVPRTISDTTKLAIATGFVGAYTTFSTLMNDCVNLSERGAFNKAAANLLLSVVLGLVAVKIGMICARRV